MPNSPQNPLGFVGYTASFELKDDTLDFMTIGSNAPTSSAAVFTQSRFAGASVLVSRKAHLRGLRGVITLSKNANVATGKQGRKNALDIQSRVAEIYGCDPADLLIASTGVIGVQYPMDRIHAGLAKLPPTPPAADFETAVRAMMTTDTFGKIHYRKCGNATLVGIAKGVGMIEPNMATMIAYFFTDALIDPGALDVMFRRVVDVTFNAVSIDTDTSTSDTAAIIANGLAGDVDEDEFEAVLGDCALALVKDIARDGEGATKMIVSAVSGARDRDQARRISKAIVNSPLVKTAVHGADPNWGRVAMAIGKCSDELDIVPERVHIAFGTEEVYPAEPTAASLAELREYLRGDEVLIHVDLGIAAGEFTSYGCDLTAEYVHINADYTT